MTSSPDEPQASEEPESEASEESETESEVLYTYLGDGSSAPSNIPPRDLTDEDWEGFTEDQQASVLAHPQLYESADKSEAEPAENEYNEEWASASELIDQARAATTTAELDAIEAQAAGRVTVSNAIATRRAELQGN